MTKIFNAQNVTIMYSSPIFIIISVDFQFVMIMGSHVQYIVFSTYNLWLTLLFSDGGREAAGGAHLRG